MRDDSPPNADAEDRSRWARFGAADPFAGTPVVTTDALRQLAALQGTNDATAALYWRLRQSGRAGRLIREVERGAMPAVDVSPHVIIVPGAFHLHHAGTGANGARILAAAAELGWTAEVLQVGSLSAMSFNADILARRLATSDGRPVLLVSLSKGSADVAMALGRPDAAMIFEKVIGWLSMSGLVFGTPLVDWLQQQRWRMSGVRLMLWWMGLRFAEVEELRHGSGGLLHEPPALPGHLRAIHVIGFPCRKHLRHRWAGRGYERLLPLGPNDGGGILLSDVERLPGEVYPVWGADHYLTPAWDFGPSLVNLMCHAATSQTAASAMPVSRSNT